MECTEARAWARKLRSRDEVSRMTYDDIEVIAKTLESLADRIEKPITSALREASFETFPGAYSGTGMTRRQERESRVESTMLHPHSDPIAMGVPPTNPHSDLPFTAEPIESMRVVDVVGLRETIASETPPASNECPHTADVCDGHGDF